MATVVETLSVSVTIYTLFDDLVVIWSFVVSTSFFVAAMCLVCDLSVFHFFE